ncbi:D-alanyl-lipoteichoic acid biosynthesis protein DltD [Microbacteriaceae bacterium 4G12]
MKQPKFGPIILAISIFCVMLFIPSRFLLPLISKEKVEQAANSLQTEKLQGIALQQKMLENKNYFPLYGSSEFARMDVYHPSNYFQVKEEGFTPFLIGRGGTQSLIHTLNLATEMDNLKNRKLIFIISPQWFVKTGITEENFASNFSSQQAYHFIFNNQLKPEMKKQVAKRLLSFEVVRKDLLLKTELEGIVNNDMKHKAKAMVGKPLAYIYRNVLDRKDLLTSMFDIKSHKTSSDKKLKNMNWEQLRSHADKTGEVESTSNIYGIEDPYFNKQIRSKLQERKGYLADMSYDQSPEYDDLQVILDIFKQTGAKPLFLSIPVKGSWYDYAAFPKERRDAYYNKVRGQIEKAGFPLVDFSQHEYDKYFLKDHIHVGWKGWVYVDEAIEKFYQEK